MLNVFFFIYNRDPKIKDRRYTTMIDDKQSFKLIGFMVTVITTLATTGISILTTLN